MKKFAYAVIMFLILGWNSVMATTPAFLNGTNQSLSISDSSQTGLDLSGNNTLRVKYKPAGQPALNKLWPLVSKDSGTQRGYVAYYMDVNNIKKIRIVALADLSTTNYSYADFTYTLTTGQEYTIDIVTTISNSISTKFELYVNGASQGNGSAYNGGTGATSIANNTAPFVIGSDGTNFANGYFLEVSIFSVTRTASDISLDWQKNLSGTETGLVASYNFANGNLSSITSVANTLSNNGGVTFPMIETAIMATTTASTTITTTNPISTTKCSGVATGLTIGTNQQFLLVGSGSDGSNYLAISETTGAFIKSIKLTTGYTPISVTQVVSNGVTSTTQVSILTSTGNAFANMVVNVSTEAITTTAW